MSTYNIRFSGEIRKIFNWLLLFSGVIHNMDNSQLILVLLHSLL